MKMTTPIKIKCLPEPELEFGERHRGVDPRKALAAFGPVDHVGLRKVRVGILGLKDDVNAAQRYIEALSQFRPAQEGNARRYRDWPGAENALRAEFIVDDRFSRIIDGARFERLFTGRVTGSAFEDLVDLFEGPLTTLFGDQRPDCVVVCIPDELGDLRIENPGLTPTERHALELLQAEEEAAQLALFQPTAEELAAAESLRTMAEDLLFRSFYRALKARVHGCDNPVPIQVLRRSTIERKDDSGHSHATRCWHLATALYYKSGGIPWRPADLPERTCFVGISFHHLKKRGGHLMYASVAQAFSTDHEPFCLKGALIDHDQRIDSQPYLNRVQAAGIMKDVLEGYEKRAGVPPKRVVVHKTSTYKPEEEAGFREGAKNIVAACDLIWMRNTAFRLLRKGTQEPWRGTVCDISGETLLFTSGYVPYWDEFPGAHIPAPLQLGSAGETDLLQRAREVLALSKMNWNSSDGVSRLPVTLLFARRVGEIMAELGDNVAPNPSFRFHA